jgi:predicted neutral ceramidase superfamily lipid hydrolase
MRIFDVLNIQHFVMYLFPALAFILVFAAGLAYVHVRRRASEERLIRIIEEYPGGIQGRNAPFPLVVTLIIAGTLVWSLLYIVLTGLLKVRI